MAVTAPQTAASPNGTTAPLVLRAEGLIKTYKRRRVVDDVQIDVPQGKIVGLLGPNGAGKTTSFYMMVGLVKPDRGKIYLGTRDISRMPIHLRSRLGIGYLAQEPSVFRKLTVEENVLLILELLGMSYKERMARTDSLLEELDLARLRHNVAATLSGGERRRCEIARALAGSPKFLLLDEPFTGVDPIAIQDIQTIIVELKRKGLGILITDHSARDILAVGDIVYIMHKGRILQSGTAKEIAESDIAKRYYLGERFKADESLFAILEEETHREEEIRKELEQHDHASVLHTESDGDAAQESGASAGEPTSEQGSAVPGEGR